MTRTLVLGTRGSELALWQANDVRSRLETAFPELGFEIKVIATTGDRLLDVPLASIGDKGLFTRQIENELLTGEIDFAVHSLKDLQTVQPENLTIAAVCERDVPNDAFISSEYASIDDLPRGAAVATGSLRRRSQLLNRRPDLHIEEIRGNVPTRIAKFAGSGLDAMVLACAGLRRLGLESYIRQTISFDVMLPAVGQGVVAIETRANDADVRAIAAKVDHAPTRTRAEAERAFLRRLDGGCQVPIGALANIEGDRLRLTGMVGSLDGSVIFREEADARSSGDAAELGFRLAETLIAKGALDLLETARAQAESTQQPVI